jgi:glycosyltransferase involved in cell wall biosynthesis
VQRLRLALEPVTGPPSPDTAAAGLRVAVVIPTLNEEEAIGGVLAAIPPGLADRVTVADSGSTDRTVERARAAGADIVSETRRGYGRACHAGAAAAADCDIIVFLDGDGSDCPELMPLLVEPIASGKYDFTIGSRARGEREPRSMSAHQLIAGYVFGAAVRLLYGVRYTDMGPFRAIRREALLRLGMREMTYGWNLEMQMCAARMGLRILEVPMAHRRRAGGVSKVSGSLKGTIKASWRIAVTFARIALERKAPPPSQPEEEAAGKGAR